MGKYRMEEGKRILSVSHSLCDKAGLAIHSVLPHHPLPVTIFLAATHTHTLLQSVDIHTRTLIPTSPSISLHRIILHPPPTSHPSVKRYFQGFGWQVVTWGADKRSQRWCTHADQWDPNIAKLRRHKDSLCRWRRLPFPDNYSSFSLPPTLSGPAWADSSVSQYGEFTHHWPFWHCYCCLLPPFHSG